MPSPRPATAAVPNADEVRAATRATYAVFATFGFVAASWASRIPQLRDRLHLTPARLAIVLLAVGVGSLLALPVAGVMVHRFTSRRTIAVMSALMSVGLATAAIGYLSGVVPVVIGFLVLGFAVGAWDVAMNVQGAATERRIGRAIMSRFHAGFSVGTVAGAVIGAAMVLLHVPITAHLVAVALVTAALTPVAVRGFLPDTDELAADNTTDRPAGTSRSVLARWTERRTLLIGIFVLAMGFAEGAGNDWINVALIDGYHAPQVLGTLGYAVFLAAMTFGRWFGPTALDRYGRVRVVRALALLAIAGLLLFVFSPVLPLAFVGATLWGIGASLGFPVGMSAAADDPGAAAGRVGVVASMGYCAYLGGPPFIGFLGDHVGVLRALTAVAVLVATSVLVAGSLTPPRASGESPAASLPAGGLPPQGVSTRRASEAPPTPSAR